MKIDWEFTAETYLDQLPAQDQAKVLHALERLRVNWDQQQYRQTHLTLVRDAASLSEIGRLFSLRVGHDLRVLLRQNEQIITVVDVVRRSQIDGLRQLRRHA